MKKMQVDLSCPSYKGEAGVSLLGVRQESGNIAILPKPLTVGNEFFQSCQDKNIIPEEYFRFTHTCAKSACKQWSNEKCAIATKAVTLLNSIEAMDEPLPVCAIRPNCTWYHQEKTAACKACKYVVTELTGQTGSI